MNDTVEPVRPEHLEEKPVPPIPDVEKLDSDMASVTLSKYRSGLSKFRTGLSKDRTEMSMRRTGMSFQRTRMSADRTLMSVMRTALSLISFGFTIFQFFGKLHEAEVLRGSHAARNFGTALGLLAIASMLFNFGPFD